MKILVIEDETLIPAFLERGFAAEGHAVDTATRGEPALEKRRDQRLVLDDEDLHVASVWRLDARNFSP